MNLLATVKREKREENFRQSELREGFGGLGGAWGMLWDALGGSGEALGSFGEALGRLCGGLGEAWGRFGGLGEDFWARPPPARPTIYTNSRSSAPWRPMLVVVVVVVADLLVSRPRCAV